MVATASSPSRVPFLVIRDRFAAPRLSNPLLLAMRFLVGYRRSSGAQTNVCLCGSALLLMGLVLIAIAMAPGG